MEASAKAKLKKDPAQVILQQQAQSNAPGGARLFGSARGPGSSRKDPAIDPRPPPAAGTCRIAFRKPLKNLKLSLCLDILFGVSVLTSEGCLGRPTW